jgi:hypothetical protein
MSDLYARIDATKKAAQTNQFEKELQALPPGYFTGFVTEIENGRIKINPGVCNYRGKRIDISYVSYVFGDGYTRTLVASTTYYLYLTTDRKFLVYIDQPVWVAEYQNWYHPDTNYLYISTLKTDAAIALSVTTDFYAPQFQPLDATLTALAGLATGANKFPYSTGADTFSQADLTAFARTILDDADAAAVIATLGIGASALEMGCLEGCAASNAADADHDITLTKGRRRDSTNTVNLLLASPITKRIDAAWSAGTGNGGIDTGSVATGTYYLYLISGDDGVSSVDALFSASSTAPTMPATYTKFRMVAAMRTNTSANILPGTWSEGNQRFLFATRIIDRARAAAAGTGSSYSVTISAPPGSVAKLRVYGSGNSGPCHFWVRETTDIDAAAAEVNSDILVQAGSTPVVELERKLSSTSTVLYRADNTANSDMGIVLIEYRLFLGAYDSP